MKWHIFQWLQIPSCSTSVVSWSPFVYSLVYRLLRDHRVTTVDWHLHFPIVQCHVSIYVFNVTFLFPNSRMTHIRCHWNNQIKCSIFYSSLWPVNISHWDISTELSLWIFSIVTVYKFNPIEDTFLFFLRIFLRKNYYLSVDVCRFFARVPGSAFYSFF